MPPLNIGKPSKICGARGGKNPHVFFKNAGGGIYDFSPKKGGPAAKLY